MKKLLLFILLVTSIYCKSQDRKLQCVEIEVYGENYSYNVNSIFVIQITDSTITTSIEGEMLIRKKIDENNFEVTLSEEAIKSSYNTIALFHHGIYKVKILNHTVVIIDPYGRETNIYYLKN